MAQYVVLSFGSDEEAQAFVAAERRDDIHILERPSDMHYGTYRKVEDFEVIGTFKQPTIFCTCSGKRGRIKPWTKGAKWGWWVCTTCKKPARATSGPVQQMRMVVSQARNLLLKDEEPQAEATVWDKGWGALGRDD